MTRSAVVLGAGAMGSALATPLRSAGFDVRLWGTWLDDHLLDAVERGEPHPRTGVHLAPGTTLFRSDELASACEGADLAVLAVASVGSVEVTRRAAPHLGAAEAVLLTSKGFHAEPGEPVQLLPDALRAATGTLPPVVAVGGPCKANEVAAGRWTAAIYGCQDQQLARRVTREVSTAAYRAEPSVDERGIEVCAPMKNVYAIALGIADGLATQGGQPFHDLKAATFARAVAELRALVHLVGGDPLTASGLAGVGDLEVTGLSGRNRLYGERIGAGEHAPAALAAMEAQELTVEGVPAAGLARRLVDEHDADAWEDLPLFAAILDVLDGDADPEKRIADAVLPQPDGGR